MKNSRNRLQLSILLYYLLEAGDQTVENITSEN